MLKCHAGCETKDVLAAIDLTFADINPAPHIVAVYEYRSEEDELLWTTERWEPKDFRQRNLPPRGERVLYHSQWLPRAREEGRKVYIVEGEKDADTMAAHGEIAVCGVNGADSWLDHYAYQLVGLDVVVIADNDDPGRAHARKVVRSLDGKVESVQLVEPSFGKDVTDQLVAGYALSTLIPLSVEETLGVHRADRVREREISWLWPGYFPTGKLTIIEGDPGDGKSVLTCDLASRMSRGLPMPDGAVSPVGSMDVAMISAEDDPEDTIVPRLRLAGADLKRLHLIVEGTIPGTPFDLRRDMPALEYFVTQHKIGCVYIDPLMAFMPQGVDSYRDTDVRQALHPLTRMAMRTGCAVVVVRHLTKGRTKAISAGGGSMAFIGAARVGYLVGPHPDDETKRAMSCVKINVGEKPPTLAYKIVPAPTKKSIPIVEWDDEPLHVTAQEILDGENDEKDAKDEGREWLYEYLCQNQGGVAWVDVAKAGKREGHTEITLRRIRKSVAHAERNPGTKKGTFWFATKLAAVLQLVPATLENDDLECIVLGCSEPRVYDGVCERHYGREGDDLSPDDPPDLTPTFTPPQKLEPKNRGEIPVPVSHPQLGPAIVLDLETGSAKDLTQRYGTDPYIRLAGVHEVTGYRDTTDTLALAKLVASSRYVGGHNVLSFDLPVLDHEHPGIIDILAMTRQRRVVDSMIVDSLVNPPAPGVKPAAALKTYSLNASCERYGVEGKTDDLKALAKVHGGFDKIPVDDPQYREYLRGDVAASFALLRQMPPNDYMWREMRVAAIGATMSAQGFLIDQPLLHERHDAVVGRKAALAADLTARYNLPSQVDGVGSPQATKEGKAALLAAFTSIGVDPAHIGLTPKGVPSFSGDSMRALAEQYGDNPDVKDLCEVVADLAGQRTVYGTALQYLAPDGRVHPQVLMLQASGRWSVTNPGLTVFGKRGGRVVERAIFTAAPGHVLIAADLSQVDARAVAAHSQDPDYIAMFDPGVDSHVEVAKLVWGDPKRRQDAKAIGHGWNYGMGIAGLAKNAGVSVDVAELFDSTMRNQFPRLVEWKDEVRAIARAGGRLDNGFGRWMRPDPKRAYTQAPALMGQGTARDLMMECLLRLPDDIVRMLRAQVHDELVLEVPEADEQDVRAVLAEAMTFEWAPPGASRGIHIVADCGPAGRNWSQCY